MLTAFQSDSFQVNAFQIEVTVAAAVVDLGAYATDGRHGSKVRSRYFRPDAAYRYRRGRS